MAKTYCHINQCDARSVQYFAIFHAVTEAYNTEKRHSRKILYVRISVAA